MICTAGRPGLSFSLGLQVLRTHVHIYALHTIRKPGLLKPNLNIDSTPLTPLYISQSTLSYMLSSGGSRITQRGAGSKVAKGGFLCTLGSLSRSATDEDLYIYTRRASGIWCHAHASTYKHNDKHYCIISIGYYILGYNYKAIQIP